MRRFLIFLVPLLFILPQWVPAQTEFSGLISTNTTWKKNFSPYILTGTVLVDTAVTLTIEPGVECRFDNGVGMRVDGEIIAIGAVNDSIRFTANTDNPEAGFLSGIQLTETAISSTWENDTTYLSGSMFQNRIFEYSIVGRIDGGGE